MSWIEKLYRTYENNTAHICDPNDATPLLPICHTTQNAQIHVVLDDKGNFLKASVLAKEEAQTIIPATEESAGRTGAKLAPHPLCDTLQYIAGDYLAWGGNPHKRKNESGFKQYIATLQGWTDWAKDQKLQSVLTYLRKGRLIKDLIEQKVLFAGTDGKLATGWNAASAEPPIFKAIKTSQKKGQCEAFVRFSVQIPGDPQSQLCGDPQLQESWCNYYLSLPRENDWCMVMGKETGLAINHPKNIRYPGDGAKLLSSNDTEGFTYRGRFTNDKEACGVGIEVSQKAHNALRWLIARQGWRNGDQAIVAWAISGADVPDPMADTFTFLYGQNDEKPQPADGYTAQEIGIQFAQRMKGYTVNLGPTDDVVVMGVDSAVSGKGRMAITFYRELTGSELLARVEAWHTNCRWWQRFSAKRVFVGAPAPNDIAEAAYGKRLDEKLRKATVERLLPCIVDGTTIPRDLVVSCVRQACNRNGLDAWEWEKALGIACALYKYRHLEKEYAMALERNRTTRDYLYGRLLALAERLEDYALYKAGEKRETNAGRMMQRFADHPYATWRILEPALEPYKARLRGSDSAGSLHRIETEIDEVVNAFATEDFIANRPLSGEFLLGYHCQRAALWAKNDQGNGSLKEASKE